MFKRQYHYLVVSIWTYQNWDSLLTKKRRGRRGRYIGRGFRSQMILVSVIKVGSMNEGPEL